MRRSLRLLLAALAVLVFTRGRADEKPEDYLADGKLKERIEVFQLQGGFAGLTGEYYSIEPDGAWSAGRVLPREKRSEPTAKGKLTAEQVSQLTKVLARHELAGLPSHGETMTNPKVVRVRFGTKLSELLPRPGKSAEEDKAIRARYEGIARAVKALCAEPEKP